MHFQIWIYNVIYIKIYVQMGTNMHSFYSAGFRYFYAIVENCIQLVTRKVYDVTVATNKIKNLDKKEESDILLKAELAYFDNQQFEAGCM